MKYRTVEFLVCPACHGDFRLAVFYEEGAEVIAGSLTCAVCSLNFDVNRGLPDLIMNDSQISRTAKSFDFLWLKQLQGKFEETTIYGMGAGDEIEAFLDVFVDLIHRHPQARVLDAGCGNGRMIASLAAEFADIEFFGVDFSESVHGAFDLSRQFRNLHMVVQTIFTNP